MLTGHQVRLACDLLKWTRYDVNRHTGLPLWMVDRILVGMADPDLFPGTTLHSAFDQAGIEFFVADDGAPGAMLREDSPTESTIGGYNG